MGCYCECIDLGKLSNGYIIKAITDAAGSQVVVCTEGKNLISQDYYCHNVAVAAGLLIVGADDIDAAGCRWRAVLGLADIASIYDKRYKGAAKL